MYHYDYWINTTKQVLNQLFTQYPIRQWVQCFATNNLDIIERYKEYLWRVCMRMRRKLFCEISPITYKISTQRLIIKRNLSDCFNHVRFATSRDEKLLPYLVSKHNSLIERKLGNVDMQLQKNKRVNLSLALPHVTNIIIRPNETFSFWKLVGSISKDKGYLVGLTIGKDGIDQGIGGGMCQFTNLIHWLILHSPLTIVERHHHQQMDLFPDYNRTTPFGVGTSIVYNYLDYRFLNTTTATYQLVFTMDDDYLKGYLYCDQEPVDKYHIRCVDEQFVQEGNDYYRCGKVIRYAVNKQTGIRHDERVLQENHAKVMYDINTIDPTLIKK